MLQMADTVRWTVSAGRDALRHRIQPYPGISYINLGFTPADVDFYLKKQDFKAKDFKQVYNVNFCGGILYEAV